MAPARPSAQSRSTLPPASGTTAAAGSDKPLRLGRRSLDLASLDHSRLLAPALAAALALDIGSENPLSGLIAVLRDRQMLLFLDRRGDAPKRLLKLRRVHRVRLVDAPLPNRPSLACHR